MKNISGFVVIHIAIASSSPSQQFILIYAWS